MFQNDQIFYTSTSLPPIRSRIARHFLKVLKTKRLKIFLYVIYAILFIYIYSWIISPLLILSSYLDNMNKFSGLAEYRWMFYKNSTVQYQFLHIPKGVQCAQRKKLTWEILFRETVLVAIVLSAASNVEIRKKIRQTWASKSKSDSINKLEIKVYFLISQPNDDNLKGIIQEMDLFNDIIITDLEENYWNLHHKVYAGMDFFLTWCQNAKYYLKIDDDVIINADRMMYYLRNDSSHWANKSATGKLWIDSIPKRSKDSKWLVLVEKHLLGKTSATPFGRQLFDKDIYSKILNSMKIASRKTFQKYIPYSVWSRDTYPTYCNGPIYLLSREALEAIVKNTAKFNEFQFEDLFYTGIVAESAGVKLYDWGDHIVPYEWEFKPETSKCDEHQTPLIFAAHSYRTPQQIDEWLKTLNSLKCH